jgi:hypothetical protein
VRSGAWLARVTGVRVCRYERSLQQAGPRIEVTGLPVTVITGSGVESVICVVAA